MRNKFRCHLSRFCDRFIARAYTIERIGAKQDGILRNHRRLEDGSYRDTVVYSIIDNEWPAVRNHLQGLMEDEYS